MSGPSDATHGRERAFHDAWAAGTALEDVAVREAFEALTAPEHRFILGLAGDLRGQRVLDVGCGLGEAAIYFALQGAEVTASDLSPEMLRACQANAARLGVTVRCVAASAESLDLPAGAFDLVYAGNLIHHVVDRERFFRNVRHVLRPGGLFVAWDPLKYNPVVNVYRRIASRVRTPDERPLGRADLALARRHLPDLAFRAFWLTTMLLFLRYFLVDRKDPNQVRYWKEILKEPEERIGWWFRPLLRLDALLLRLPGLWMLGWNVVLWGRRPAAGEAAP